MASKKKSKPVPPEAALVGLPKRITELLEKESDRGAILILAAYLEEILALIVRAAVTTDSIGKALLEFRSPAGDFSSKITLCEAFGLIHSDEAKALHCLRKMRNSAAHFDQKGRGFDVLFNSPQTAEQAGKLFELLNLKKESDDPEYLRAWFVISGRLLATKLMIRLAFTDRPSEVASVKEMAKYFREEFKNTEWGKELKAAEKLAKEGKPEKFFEHFRARMKEMKEAAEEAIKQSTQPKEEA